MTVRVGINGFGRIGRNFFRVAKERGADIDFVAVNDLGSLETMAHLLKYDSVLGTLPNTIKATKSGISVDGDELKVLSERDPANLPWADLGVDLVLECTGKFLTPETLQGHLDRGAKRVIVAAPVKVGDVLNIVVGVNEHLYNPARDRIVTAASCTTNCLAPVVKVLLDEFGFRRGVMTTVHAYTNDQNILDLPHKDLRRARAAAMSIIPTTTGAAKATALVIPEVKGKIDGIAMRVPTPDVSVVDLVAELEKEVTAQQVNDALRAASEGRLKGILGYEEEELVSIDFTGNPHSSIVDAPTTNVIGGLVKVMAWYDNEWGFSNRMVDMTKFVLSKGF